MTMLEVADARALAIASLAPSADDDPNVQVSADAVSPPTLVVYWADPWLEPATTTGLRLACTFTARLNVLAVAGRLEPGEGVAELERLVSYVIARLCPPDWSLPTVSTPLRWQAWQGPPEYLAAEIRYRVPVYTEGA